MDHILVIDKVPIDSEVYTKKWITKQILDLSKRHHARILNPQKDIFFEEGEYTYTPKRKKGGETQIRKCYKIVIIIDGWNHMKPLPNYHEYFKDQGRNFDDFESIESHDYRNFIEDLFESDSE